MKKQSQIIVGFIVVFLIVLFSVLNVDKVPLNLGFFEIKAPLILIILISAFLGAILIFVSSFATISAKNKEIKKLQGEQAEKIQALDKEWEEKFNAAAFETQEEKEEFTPELKAPQKESLDEEN